jgi:flagellar biosynthesis protein FlhF
MAEALAAVKRDLGRDAVILHTRSFRKGGLLGLGGRQMWEITASKSVNVPHRRIRPLQSSSAPKAPKGVQAKPTVKVIEGPSHMPVAGYAATMLRAAPHQDKLSEQVQALTGMVEKLVRSQESKAAPAVPEELFESYLSLVQQEVAEDIAGDLIQKVKSQLTGDQLRDKALINAKLRDFISGMIPTSITTIPPADGRPHVIALVGPTGVGKTTTIAKLAANIKLRQNRRVGLITLDTYRIAAVEQLRTYAQIIGVPLRVVMDPSELPGAIDEMGGRDAVLIDTAGRSPNDTERLWQLKQFLQAARPDEVHLVLSTTANPNNIENAMERFSPLGVDRLILTKLDEAVSFGMVLSVVRRMNVALSFVTTGQDVPDDIEVTEGRRIAGLILAGTKER